MPTNKQKMAAIKGAITRFDHAAQNMAFRGASDPDTWEDIKDEYHRSRDLLEELVWKYLTEGT